MNKFQVESTCLHAVVLELQRDNRHSCSGESCPCNNTQPLLQALFKSDAVADSFSTADSDATIMTHHLVMELGMTLARAQHNAAALACAEAYHR